MKTTRGKKLMKSQDRVGNPLTERGQKIILTQVDSLLIAIDNSVHYYFGERSHPAR